MAAPLLFPSGDKKAAPTAAPPPKGLGAATPWASHALPAPGGGTYDPAHTDMFSNAVAGLGSLPRAIYDQIDAASTALTEDLDRLAGAKSIQFDWNPTHGPKTSVGKLATNLTKEQWLAYLKAIGYEGRALKLTPTRESLQAAEKFWHDNPVGAAGAALLPFPIIGRVGGIAAISRGLRAADPTLTAARALRLAKEESFHPGILAVNGIEGSPFTPRISQRPWSRSSTGRAAQRGYEKGSDLIEQYLGPNAPLSTTRRQAAGARRTTDLARERNLVTYSNLVRPFVDYLNEGTLRNVTGFDAPAALRRDTLESRDAAVAAALHGPAGVNPVDAVAALVRDAQAQIASGRREAHNGNIGELDHDKRVGQKVYVHPADGGERQPATVTRYNNKTQKVTVQFDDGTTREVKPSRATFHQDPKNPIPGQETVPLGEFEKTLLQKRVDLLSKAHEELLASPKLQDTFTRAVDAMTEFSQRSEQMMLDRALARYRRVMDDPKSSVKDKQKAEASIRDLRMRLDERRDMFLHRYDLSNVEGYANTTRVAAEIAPGAGSPLEAQVGGTLASLSPAESAATTHLFMQQVVTDIQEIFGGGVVAHQEGGIGAWGHTKNPNVLLDYISDNPDDLANFADALGYVAQQTEIFTSRGVEFGSGTHNGFDVRVTSGDFDAFVDELAKHEDISSFDSHPTNQTVRIILTDPSHHDAVLQALEDVGAAAKTPYTAKLHSFDVRSFSHEWDTDQTGVGYLDRIEARGSTPEQLARIREVGSQSAERITEAADRAKSGFRPEPSGYHPLAEVDLNEGLWPEMRTAMEKAGYPEDQIRAWMQFESRQARLWALEKQGRNPTDYLGDPEGKNLAGVRFGTAGDIDRATALLQMSGDRSGLVAQTGMMRHALPSPTNVNELEGPGQIVMTPDGIGRVQTVDTSTSLVQVRNGETGALETYSASELGTGVTLDNSPLAPIFKLQSLTAVEHPKFPAKGSASKMEQFLQGQGVSKGEMELLNIDSFLRSAGDQPVTLADLERHIVSQVANVKVKETLFTTGATHGTKWGSDELTSIHASAHQYHELVIQLDNDPVRFRSSEDHWRNLPREDSPIVHIRFHEIEDTNGVPVLMIDEIQSDWDIAGRKQGYARKLSPNERMEVQRLTAKSQAMRRQLQALPFDYQILQGWADDQIDRFREEVPHGDYRNMTELKRVAIEHLGKDPRYGGNPEWVARRDAWERGKRIRSVEKAADSRIFALTSVTNGVPTHPLVGSDVARSIALKRMIRWAADHGQEDILWTRGHEQGIRYNLIPGIQHNANMEPDEYFYFNEGSSDGEQMGQPLDPGHLFGHQLRIQGTNELSSQGLFSGDEAMVPIHERMGHEGADRPVEVKWDDLDHHYGDRFVRLPDGEEYGAGRHAEIIHDRGDTGTVRPVSPDADPMHVQMSSQGRNGDDGEAWWDVTITNRLGEPIFKESFDGEDLFHETGADAMHKWIKMIEQEALVKREWMPADEQHQWGWMKETPITGPEADRLKKALSILEDSPEFEDQLDSLIRYPTSTFDEDGWDEFKRENFGGDHEDMLNAPSDGHNDAHEANYDELIPGSANTLLKPYKKEHDFVPVHVDDLAYEGHISAYQRGVLSEGTLPAWRMKLPAKMREDAKGAQPLLQRGQSDVINGASEWVRTSKGQQRLITLTEDGDFSTLWHEFNGHAVEEMKKRYPEVWQPVEEHFGKPLDRWTRGDHERFAEMNDTYLRTGKAPTFELASLFALMKEWMSYVVSRIRESAKTVPPEVKTMLDTYYGAGVKTTRPGARAYVPHTSVFDTQYADSVGPTRLQTGANLVGKPKVDPRAYNAGRNRGVLWESGELALSARPLIDQLYRRLKVADSEAIRQKIWDESKGNVVSSKEQIPKGAWLIRNPAVGAGTDRVTSLTKAGQRLSEKDFARLIGEGDTPSEFDFKLQQLRDEHYREPGLPAWEDDYKNVRWVHGSKLRKLIDDVYPSGPRSQAAAALGSVNTLARLAGIYMRPIHYLIGNVPQNVMMVALTHPSALLNSAKYGSYSMLPRVIRDMAQGPMLLARDHADLYNRIKADTGDISAGAGLPEFYTTAQGFFQKSERRLNKFSGRYANWLGDKADQPYRVAVWQAHAKDYGFHTPADYERLLDAEDGTELARLRDEIAHRTREDMIDFNTISPWERQNIGRFFYLWAFTRGFAKWPITFAREYPGRTALALSQADPNKSSLQGTSIADVPAMSALRIPGSKTGTMRDLTFLDPTGGLRQNVETGISAAHGNFTGIGGMLTPPLDTAGQAIFGGPNAPQGGVGGFLKAEAENVVPGFKLAENALTPGLSGLGRVDKVLEVTGRFNEKPMISPQSRKGKKLRADIKAMEQKMPGSTPEQQAPVLNSIHAYWHYKFLETEIKYGAMARRKGTSLTNREKLGLTYAVANIYFPEASLPPIEQALAADPTVQAKFIESTNKAMFALRSAAAK